MDFVRDAWRFAQTFAALFEDHPLLVYLGALPFAPTTSTIYQTFHNSQLNPTVPGGFPQSWSGLQMVLLHPGAVMAVAFSSDGSRILSGSNDGAVHVWNAKSGIEIVPPFEGHENIISSVSFSPRGDRIASGANDNTVRLRDAESGTEILPPI